MKWLHSRPGLGDELLGRFQGKEHLVRDKAPENGDPGHILPKLSSFYYLDKQY